MKKWVIFVLIGIILIRGVQAQEELIIGWQFHEDNVTYLSEMIDLAPEYSVNHVELSHNMVWHTEDILKSTDKQRDINRLIEQAHNNGIELFIWTHEISKLPNEFMVNGKTDLDNPLLWGWLEDKYVRLFEAIPDVDGIVLTFSETDIPVYEDDKVITTMSRAERVAKILNTVNGVVKSNNKILWARTWGERTEWVAEGIRLTPEDIWVENKNVISDFDTYWPHHPMTGAYGNRPQIVEFDLNGQYLGRSWIPSPKPDYLKYRLKYAINKGVRGFVGRVGTLRQDFLGDSGEILVPNTHAINTPNEINLYAFSKIIQNPDIDPKDIWQEWVSAKYGEEAAPYIISAYNRTFEIARQLYREAGVHQGNEDSSRISISTHSDLPWWGVFDIDRPEGGYWKRIYKDPIFKNVVDNKNLHEELNQRFGPIEDLCKESISDIELAKPYLTQEQYDYLKKYLERELMAVQLFKQIKKVLIRYGMVEIHNSLEHKNLLNNDLQDLLTMADSIEDKFGSEIPLFRPEDIRIFVNGFDYVSFVESKCDNDKCEPGESLWNCPTDCVDLYYDFIEKNIQYKKSISKEELDNQIIDADKNPYNGPELTASEIKEIIIDSLNIEFLIDKLPQREFKVSVLQRIEFSEYTQKTLLFDNPDVGTFNAILLIPKEGETLPAIVGLHGHGDSSKIFMNDYFGTELAKAGFVVIMPSFRVMECGETERKLSEELLLNGFSLMGLRVYESLLLIEYIKSNNLVDNSKIGIMGYSGGSTTSNLVARVSDDVKALVYDFKAQFSLGCDNPPFIHCETVPTFASYRNQINDQSLLKIPSVNFGYGYKPTDDEKEDKKESNNKKQERKDITNQIISFFRESLEFSSKEILETSEEEPSKSLLQKFLGFLKKIFKLKEKEKQEELTELGGFKTLEEYQKYCHESAENKKECSILCEENPKICLDGKSSVKGFLPDITHQGSLTIGGTKTMLIENKKYSQQGNVYIDENAKLIIKNSQFMLGRGDIPTIHANIITGGILEIENSTIFPDRGALLVVSTSSGGKVNITNSPTNIHLLMVHDGAKVTMTNSEMIFDIGGLLQIHGGDTKLVNSTIGALGLSVPANAYLDISGLKSGDCFESWDVHDMIPEADYNLVLENSCILKDDFTGKLKNGPFERGWLFFLDSDAHVRISDSELRKVFIDLRNENVEFENLKVEVPSSLKYRDIELKDIIIKGQWPFTFMDSEVTIRNSDYLFLQPSGRSTITLINSHMSEFIPREFFGTMIFENSSWYDAGEIIGGEPTHAMENDFTIKGSLKMQGVRENLQWRDAQVTREYDVLISDEDGNPIEGALVKIGGKEFVSDIDGKTKFSLVLNEFNYNKPHILEATKDGKIIDEKEIDFFTETPIIFY